MTNRSSISFLIVFYPFHSAGIILSPLREGILGVYGQIESQLTPAAKVRQIGFSQTKNIV